MNIEDYDTEDFACDHTFQQYCREENESSIAFWTAWINQHPEKSDLIISARQLVVFLGAGQGSRMKHLNHLKRGLQQRELLETSLKNSPGAQTRHTRISTTYLAALAACLVVGIIGYFVTTNFSSIITLFTTSEGEYTSVGVDRKTVILPDGSLVTLNTNSKITLDPQFSNTRREVTLAGEGFFEIAHDAEHPFLVHTEAVTVKVLGTVFNIRAYPQSKNETETYLIRGKVEVSLNGKAGSTYILKPNQKLVTRYSSNDPEKQTTSLESRSRLEQELNSKPTETAWLRNRLELSNERLQDIALKLSNWYGIEIEFEDDEAKSYRYSGTFESETPIRALEALQLSYPFKIRSENGKILISE